MHLNISNQTASRVHHSGCLCVAGFTLIEIVVSLALLGLLAAIFGMGLVAVVRHHEFSRTNVYIAQQSQLGMTRIQRELMEAVRVTEVTDDQTTHGINRFIIYERMVPEKNQGLERFALHLNPTDKSLYLYTELGDGLTQLDETTVDQGDVLIDRVDNATFECFKGSDPWDEDSDEQSWLSTIRVTLDFARLDKPDTSQQFKTVVHLRNNNNAGGIPPETKPQTRNQYSCFIASACIDRQSSYPWDFTRFYKEAQ